MSEKKPSTMNSKKRESIAVGFRAWLRSHATMNSKKRESVAAYGFLLPNLVGFLAFTSIPVIISLYMAFTQWNIFSHPKWIGMENFVSLLWFHKENGKIVMNDPFFWQYIYNTVFMMAAIPIGMAGNLLLAILMNQKVKGIVLFRTLYFLPTVCSGVALLILWKYLYNDLVGLINKSIRMAGEQVYATAFGGVAVTVVSALILGVVIVAMVAAVIAFAQWLCEKLSISWPEWLFRALMVLAGVVTFAAIAYAHSSIYGAMKTVMTSPPDWLGTVSWAKPSLMLMGFWGGLGGVNMFLYLAALQGVPPSLYEAAEIDGANSWSKFWAVTWPLISPTTFFILIMSIIGGFQGGFMVANVMTGGGPAGSTTTVEYYLYQTAFEKFHMGYASAIAWFLFAVILILTLFTWKLGGKVVTYD